MTDLFEETFGPSEDEIMEDLAAQLSLAADLLAPAYQVDPEQVFSVLLSLLQTAALSLGDNDPASRAQLGTLFLEVRRDEEDRNEASIEVGISLILGDL